MKAWRMTAVRMVGNAYVGEKKVAEAMVTCRLVDTSRARSSSIDDAAESE